MITPLKCIFAKAKDSLVSVHGLKNGNIYTVIAFFAISNLIRSLISISTESQKPSWTDTPRVNKSNTSNYQADNRELYDEEGQPINEPLLVIRSVSYFLDYQPLQRR